jgi:hypothetical protein
MASSITPCPLEKIKICEIHDSRPTREVLQSYPVSEEAGGNAKGQTIRMKIS